MLRVLSTYPPSISLRAMGMNINLRQQLATTAQANMRKNANNHKTSFNALRIV
jgi:hypothetical protein